MTSLRIFFYHAIFTETGSPKKTFLFGSQRNYIPMCPKDI